MVALTIRVSTACVLRAGGLLKGTLCIGVSSCGVGGVVAFACCSSLRWSGGVGSVGMRVSLRLSVAGVVRALLCSRECGWEQVVDELVC